MDRTRIALLQQQPGLQDALQRVAMDHAVTLEDLVQTVLGRPTATVYEIPDAPSRAAAALADHHRQAIAKLGTRWPAPAPPRTADEPEADKPGPETPEGAPDAPAEG